nr:MAG TPA: hypothetical protein [Caudoviricetes sp.]
MPVLWFDEVKDQSEVNKTQWGEGICCIYSL